MLEGETIVKIPVLQKAFYRIYLYMPGMNVINGQHAVGQRQRSLGFTLDGVNAKEPVLGNPNSHETVITSTLDMIQEFKMYTTGMPAEFGHSSGGQLSGVFKSGTNEFHGSLEDRYLNGALVHRQYFDQLKRCQNALNICNPFTYHEMGGTVGGPVIIPKLYNGKDKTFFLRRCPAAPREGVGNLHWGGAKPGNVRRRLLVWWAWLPNLRSGNDSAGERCLDCRPVSRQRDSGEPI